MDVIIIQHYLITIHFGNEYCLSFLYAMRRWGILIIICCGLLGSCTSEYEERMDQAKLLRGRLEKVNQADNGELHNTLEQEIAEIHSEIIFLSKISGNEDLFMKELFSK